MLFRFPYFQKLNPNWPDERSDFQNSEALLLKVESTLHVEWWLQLGLFSKLKANADQVQSYNDFIYLNRSLENRFLFPSW